jgi:SAM-dependent methyltransferase
MQPIPIRVPASLANFDEAAYLRANPDIIPHIENGGFADGLDHFNKYGWRENRLLDLAPDLTEARARKMQRLKPFFRADMACAWRNGIADYLTPELRRVAEVSETENVSGHNYDATIRETIYRYPEGLMLDCGAGLRNEYFPNVVNFEIRDYHSTDVLGIAECLPFLSETFDAVFSVAVLEHVKQPWKAAHEISRVLKTGGRLVCTVPFLQPVHGYPHHYFNMTRRGLASLFEDRLRIDTHGVPYGSDPILALCWIVQRWAAQLPNATRKRFLALPISTLAQDWQTLVHEDFCRELPREARFELAACTYMTATKR